MEVDTVSARSAVRVRGVDLRDLCANLREYLCLVAAGETVIVTDCGRAVAEIAAPKGETGQRVAAADRRSSPREAVAPGPVMAPSVLSLAGLPAGVGVDGGAV